MAQTSLRSVRASLVLRSCVFVVVSRSSQLVPALVFDGYFGSDGRPRETLENPRRERPKRARNALNALKLTPCGKKCTQPCTWCRVPSQDVDPPRRVRREDRWAEEEQPAPVYSEKRHVNHAYRAVALVCARGTGKNTGVKREKGGPFQGPTAEAAMALRDQWIDDYLHAPPKRSKKDMGAGTTTSTEPREQLCLLGKQSLPLHATRVGAFLCESEQAVGLAHLCVHPVHHGLADCMPSHTCY